MIVAKPDSGQKLKNHKCFYLWIWLEYWSPACSFRLNFPKKWIGHDSRKKLMLIFAHQKYDYNSLKIQTDFNQLTFSDCKGINDAVTGPLVKWESTPWSGPCHRNWIGLTTNLWPRFITDEWWPWFAFIAQMERIHYQANQGLLVVIGPIHIMTFMTSSVMMVHFQSTDHSSIIILYP